MVRKNIEIYKHENFYQRDGFQIPSTWKLVLKKQEKNNAENPLIMDPDPGNTLGHYTPGIYNVIQHEL